MFPQQPQLNTPNGRSEPSPLEKREQLARAGDVRGLFQVIAHSGPGLLDMRSAYSLLYQALDVASSRDPAGFAGDIFQQMVAFSSYVLLRVQLQCKQTLEQYDYRSGGQVHQLPSDLLEYDLPQLHEIQAQVSEVLHAQASTARLWQLARKGPCGSQEGPVPKAGGRASGDGTSKHRVRDIPDDSPN
jgi:hypothetical protein